MANQAGHELVAQTPRRWEFLAAMMGELNLKTFVEVGCKEGRTTGHILENVPDSTVIAIDPWDATVTQKSGERDSVPKPVFGGRSAADIETLFWKNVGEHRERCTMLRTTSAEAAALTDQQHDLVFIDALHDYENVTADLAAWWPKVRAGGVLAGHDFNHKWPGVERAVAEKFNLFDVGVGPDSVWFVVKPDAG